MELIPVVNLQDEILFYKNRDDITSDDIFRVASVWVLNDKKEVLLGRRSLTKKTNPNKFAPIVNGTVNKDESYEENALKELKEEIGITRTKLNFLTKLFVKEKWQLFVSYFSTQLTESDQLNFDSNEIAEIVYWPLAELEFSLINQPEMFVPDFKRVYEEVRELLFR